MVDWAGGKDYDRCALNVAVKASVGFCAALVPSIVLLRGRTSRSFAFGLGTGIGVGMALHENMMFFKHGPTVVQLPEDFQKEAEYYRDYFLERLPAKEYIKALASKS
ncbi:unnamed protein product [Amoebophrya sp. A120]|nr:unnamed protein product [Amoebophrya sp. A120]|eukprot:GSA120T00007408001.1